MWRSEHMSTHLRCHGVAEYPYRHGTRHRLSVTRVVSDVAMRSAHAPPAQLISQG